MKRFPLIVLAIAWLFAGLSHAETPATIAAVKAAVPSLGKRPGMDSATLGVAVLRLGENPEMVVDVAGKQSFIPASTTKILTTVAALDVLGPEMVFETKLGYRGTLEAGELQGDLVILGTGDPTLAEYGWDELFKTWTEAMKTAGITSITGRVLGDASFYQGPPRPGTWSWMDLGNYYAGGADGLNFYNNTYNVRFRTRAVGSRAKYLGTTPELPGVTFHNEMMTGNAGSGDQGYVYAAPYGQVVFLRGSIPASGTFTIKGALPEPALTCAQLFHAHLKKQGIQISEDPSTQRMDPATGALTEIHAHTSKPLSNLLQRMNHKSINLFAETILRRVGKAQGNVGSTQAGVNAVNAYFTKHGIRTEGFAMNDGSGLSRLNLITPRQMVYLLKAANSDAHAEIFRNSLPVAGESGTLKNVAKGTAAVGRVRAKSGTIDRVKCYAGYVDARSGTRYAFAIMVNNYAKTYGDVKPGIVSIMARMAEQ
ncbi:MAG: D-alanyl-D-alanine carboxypeptidase/D-alanyl-D-alanine-endopeptidase (penicillin-binding protein 4) [Verrucomicrobiales bacterium]|jgi:D-alanyl-D-alanine carboxypeptidase/D-alanyl-D-alanine-endopeptidase (penicillin-binding protein 4)